MTAPLAPMIPEERLDLLRILIEEASWEYASDPCVVAEFSIEGWETILRTLNIPFETNDIEEQ